MKAVSYLLTAIAFIAITTSCNKVSYKKTSSGLLYKIIPSSGKDSTAKYGNWLKIHFVQKRNDDSVLQSTYGKMPIYQQLILDPSLTKYNPAEIFPMLKKGDSAVIVMFVDSLTKQPGAQLPPFLKKGDKITLYFRVVDLFRNDSLKRVDEQKEFEVYKPIMEKERKEQMEKMEKQMIEQKDKELADAEKSGEAETQRKAMEAYLAGKHITAQKTGHGTYVVIKEQGTGTQAVTGKFVNVKYSGRTTNDSTFESSSYAFQLGKRKVIDGWDEGLTLFKQGGKGTLYIPGFLAYGKNPPYGSPFKPNEPLIFDIELLSVADSLPRPTVQPGE